MCITHSARMTAEARSLTPSYATRGIAKIQSVLALTSLNRRKETLKTDHNKQPIESNAEFNARIDREDAEAMQIKCPLDSCSAEVGQPCKTDAGEQRIRHARRLWQARKLAKG